MAGMNLEAQAARQLRAVTDALPLGLGGGMAMVGESVAPRAGMDLDHGSADRDRRLDLPGLGSDEQRDADAGIGELGNDGRQSVVLAGDVETAFGGALLAPLGHEAGGMRAGLYR